MRFVLHIDTDGDAFRVLPGYEIASVLRRAASQIEASHVVENLKMLGQPLVDSNGNTCGGIVFVQDED